eukprot:4039_1
MSFGYLHHFVELKCCIKTLPHHPVRIALPTSTDWTKNLNSILNRIPQKFKSLQNVNPSTWTLMINNSIINKTDTIHFTQLMNTTSPIVTIYIISAKALCVFRVEYKSKAFMWTPSEDEKDWNDNYTKLKAQAVTYFQLNENVFELKDINDNTITNGLDIQSLWIKLKNDKIHNIAIIKVIYHINSANTISFNVIYKSLSLIWVPTITHIYDEKEWEKCYKDLKTFILTQLKNMGFNTHNVKHILKDNYGCSIDNGNDLSVTWELLMNGSIESHLYVCENNELKVSNKLINEMETNYMNESDSIINIPTLEKKKKS